MNDTVLPKVELHCHLEGIVDPGIIEILESRKIAVALSSQEFKTAYPVSDFNSFIRWCHLQDAFEGDILAYTDIVDVYISRLKQQQVIYSEIMFAPGEL